MATVCYLCAIITDIPAHTDRHVWRQLVCMDMCVCHVCVCVCVCVCWCHVGACVCMCVCVRVRARVFHLQKKGNKVAHERLFKNPDGKV